ncbi:MAG: ribonuclease E inhibitor RraB [Candidatus Thiodiazotropha sp. (ex Notomyrtea botanica)]|nr:ribonuclease E inhibitor RraB [Candidatus Thiodiazotropha sp. (ex Notomyrtea botanica)]
MTWPNDADGDVLRGLDQEEFDFSRAYEIDFNVDFESWPPPEKAISLLSEKYGNIEIIQPEEEYSGYVVFRIIDKLTYELVMHIQEETSLIMGSFKGVCESWGLYTN